MRHLATILVASLLAGACTAQVSKWSSFGDRSPNRASAPSSARPQATGAAAARSAAWARDSSPNPLYLGAIEMARADVPLRDLVPGAPWGSYTTATPLLALEVGDGVARLELTTDGASLLAFLPDGRHVRGSSPLVIDRPAAGTYRIHHLLGAIEKARVSVEVADPTRGWGPDVPVLAVPGAPKLPVVYTGAVRGERRALPGQRCRNGFATQPDLVLQIERPLRNVDLTLLRPNDAQRIRVVGPLEPGSSLGTPRCGGASLRSDTLHGTYAVFVGATTEPYGSFHLMLVADGTQRDPMYASPKLPDDLPIERRGINDHFVFQTDAWKSGARPWTPEATAELFTRAPRALFAYPKHDLTGHVGARHEALVAPVFPKAGEPVLVLGAAAGRVQVVTADSETYDVDPAKLAGRPTGPLWLPTEPRRRDVSFDTLVTDYGTEHRADLDTYRALKKAREACYYREWSKVYPDGLPAGTDIYEITLRGGKIIKAQSALDRLHRKLRSRCKLDRVEKAQEKLRQQLLQTHVARWRAALATVRARFDEPPK